jgi:hypothetical protein
MQAVKRIAKRGRNDFHKYDYATEADIAEVIRKELAARNVMLYPAVSSYVIHELPDKAGKARDPLTILSMAFEFRCGDTQESISKPWLGVGQDSGDKGCYKAMTGGEKYFLLKTFLIPTGDDPEREERQERQAQARPDKATKKARPSLPPESGAVYIEKVTPKKRGNVEWSEVTISTGETFPVQSHKHQLVSLCMELAQGTQAVILETHQNDKGKTELDGVRRWPQVVEADAAAAAAPPVADLKASDIPF